MYSYNYNMPQFRGNMYRQNGNHPNDQRFIPFIPFLLGGVAGYAIGNNTNYNRPNYYYPQPYYYPYPTYYNNNYYYNPYNY